MEVIKFRTSLYILILFVGTALCSLRLPIIKNKIKTINTRCDTSTLNATIILEGSFKGMVSAKDFSQECKTIGTINGEISISLPTSGCGVRLSSKNKSNDMQYTVTLIIQQDRYLRQIADQEVLIRCKLPPEQLSLRSKNVIEEFQKEVKQNDEKNVRSGRMKQDDFWKKQLQKSRYEYNTRLNEAIKSSKVWMEILSAEYNQNVDVNTGQIQVGEPAKLVVKSVLPVGIGWKLVDCNAHDGLDDSSQNLIDKKGCSVDEMLMPQFIYGPKKTMSLLKHEEAISIFPAFKFPDRDRLHLSCMLHLCKGECSPVDCSNSRKAKDLDESDSNVLDKIKLFNSIEVLAPTVNEYYRSKKMRTNDPEFLFGEISGDETFCVPYEKMAIVFCILGSIFLVAVVVAIFSMLKSRIDQKTIPNYTISLFSSSSQSGSAYGSKLLLNDHSSSAVSSTTGIQYGRIL